MIISQGYDENGGTEQGGGVVITGDDNIVRGCTLFDTAEFGVYSSGTNNAIIRNLIYTIPTTPAPTRKALALHSSGDIITFNSARHFVVVTSFGLRGNGSDIRFNRSFRPGMMCKDVGVIYSYKRHRPRSQWEGHAHC